MSPPSQTEKMRNIAKSLKYDHAIPFDSRIMCSIPSWSCQDNPFAGHCPRSVGKDFSSGSTWKFLTKEDRFNMISLSQAIYSILFSGIIPILSSSCFTACCEYKTVSFTTIKPHDMSAFLRSY